MFDAQDLADRYLAIFNEPEADRRTEMIGQLWARDGEHHGGFDGKGHADLIAGIQGSHDNWIKTRGWKWVSRTPAKARQNVVHFLFDAVLAADPSQVVAGGAEVLIVGEDGKLSADYTFVLHSPG